MSAVDDLVAACLAKIELADATLRKDRALWRMVREEHRTVTQAAEDAVAALRAAGLTDDQIRLVGVSRATIVATVRRPPLPDR